jgi:hypothetical protein
MAERTARALGGDECCSPEKMVHVANRWDSRRHIGPDLLPIRAPAENGEKAAESCG